MMDPQIKQTIITALQNHFGDDYARAQAAFRNCTPDQMNQEYGDSGKTRAEILKEYEDHFKRVETALQYVRAA